MRHSITTQIGKMINILRLIYMSRQTHHYGQGERKRGTRESLRQSYDRVLDKENKVYSCWVTWHRLFIVSYDVIVMIIL